MIAIAVHLEAPGGGVSAEVGNVYCAHGTGLDEGVCRAILGAVPSLGLLALCLRGAHRFLDTDPPSGP